MKNHFPDLSKRSVLPDIKTKQRYHKKRKLHTNVSDKNRDTRIPKKMLRKLYQEHFTKDNPTKWGLSQKCKGTLTDKNQSIVYTY